jgi:hypothetical protein
MLSFLLHSTVSIAKCPTVGRLMNYELQKIWKEAVMLFTKYSLDDQIYEDDM